MHEIMKTHSSPLLSMSAQYQGSASNAKDILKCRVRQLFTW